MEQNSGIKKNVISGFFWKAMENGGDQLVTFLISVVLARLLGPEKYGTMATMLIFISVANVIIQNGFQTALIQKKEVNDLDLSSVFWIGLIISAALYAFIFVSAPFIADFFSDSDITPMLRVLALMLFSGSVVSVEIAIVARNMNFRLQCIATILADIFSGIAGVIAAFKGAGTWALVLQQLIKNICLMAFLYISLKWRPKFAVSAERLKRLFSYGWKVLVSGLIDTAYSNIYTPFISRLYDAAMVGFYNRGNQFPQVIVNSMASTVQAVMLPAFSKTQDEKQKAKSMLRRTIKLSGFVMFPALLGVMAVADSMVMLLLGPEWMPAVPLLRLCCLSYSVWHIHIANLQAINANGRSDIYLKLEIIKKIIGVAVLIFSIRLGIGGMLFMKALFDYVCTFINGWPNKKIVGYGPFEQWKDILPEFVLSAFMGIAVYVIEIIMYGGSAAFISGTISVGSCLVLMVVQIAVGGLIYLAAALLFRMESLRYLVETVKLVVGKKL